MFHSHLIQKGFGLGESVILDKLFAWKLIKKFKITSPFPRQAVALGSRQLTGQKMQPCLCQDFGVRQMPYLIS